MNEYESLSHTKWECKYHVVFIPKYRRQTLYKELRRHVGAVFRTLAEQKECRIEEGHMQDDHVHMMISIPHTEQYCRKARTANPAWALPAPPRPVSALAARIAPARPTSPPRSRPGSRS